MSAFKFYKFPTVDMIGYFLNGGIYCGKEASRGFADIVGKTLIFTQPASHTVTFTAGASSKVDSGYLSFKEVATQITAVMTGIDVLTVGSEIWLVEKAPSAGVTVTALGTANPVIGFNTAANTVGKVFKYPDGVTGASTPHWVQTYYADGNHVLVTRE